MLEELPARGACGKTIEDYLTTLLHRSFFLSAGLAGSLFSKSANPPSSPPLPLKSLIVDPFRFII